jgi:hypothetical protein
MLSSIQIRLGGLLAILGGTASAAVGLLYVFEARGLVLAFTEQALRKGHYENPALTMLLIGVLVAIVTLHVIQRRHYGSRGALAFFVTIAGVAMIVGGSLLGALGPSMAYATMLASVVGILAVSVGMVVLGIVTMMSGVLPRWCGAAVIAGSPLFVFLGFMIANLVEMSLSSIGLSSEVPGGLGWGMLWVLAGVPWAIVGYAVIRAGARQAGQPSRVR